MRVMILNQYYYPDLAPTAQLATDLGGVLAARGHEVVAVASNAFYAGRGRLPLAESHDGVQIRRVPASAFGRSNRLLRAVDYATFLSTAVARIIASSRPDVLLTLSTPPLIAAVGLISKAVRRTRLVYWVMDVYPELAVTLGVLRSDSLATKILRQLAGAVLRRADAVIALDEAMRERLIAAGAPPERVTVIDNWCDGEHIRPRAAAGSKVRRELDLEGKFVVAYSGNMGLAHDFVTLGAAMQLLRDEAVHWLFIGDGPKRAWLERFVDEQHLQHNVTFLGYRSHDELPDSLAAADASIVSMEPDVAGLLVPSKLYGILASGRPVLYVGPRQGRAFDVVANERVGFAVDNGAAPELARAIVTLKSDAKLTGELGRRARDLFDRRFTRERALERHVEVLSQVAAC